VGKLDFCIVTLREIPLVLVLKNLRLVKGGLIIIFINCNWVVTRWQWLFYTYTNMEKKK